jgi:signal transduction histidine kinase
MILGPPTVYPRAMTNTASMKVLIVDGSKEKRSNLVEALGELTNVVVQGAVSHVRTAIRAVADANPDVIVTGVLLPDGEGTHLIERVRRMSTPPSIVVVADAASDEQRVRYMLAGADRYVESTDEAQAAVAGLRAREGVSPFESQRLLGRMTAGVVHDLNNYLGVLDGSLELMHRRPQERAELWPSIRSTLDSINGLVGTLLAYARGGNPAVEDVDMGELVRHVMVVGRRMIPANVIHAVEIAGGLRRVQGVRAELEQMILNLVINACDAMPHGGELLVSVKPATSHALLVEVSDTGSGKPFLMFSEGRSPSTKKGRNGVGLGMGIVHGAVERHRGAIRVLERAGGGTIVAVMLPTQIA